MQTLFDQREKTVSDQWTIQEVIMHPAFDRFAQEATACGRAVIPDAHPWMYMGMSDADILYDLTRYETGAVISAAEQQSLLAGIRHTEQRTIEHWLWWIRDGVPN